MGYLAIKDKKIAGRHFDVFYDKAPVVKNNALTTSEADAFAPQGYIPGSDQLGLQDVAYAGTWAPYMILPATFALDSINKSLFYVKDSIKKEHSIGTLDFSNPWQPVSKAPVFDVLSGNIVNGGPINIFRRQLVPQTQMLITLFDPRDLELTAWSEVLSTTLLSRELPQTIETFVVYQVMRRAFEQIEDELWMGSQAFSIAGGSTYATGHTGYTVTINGIQYTPWQIQFFDGIFAKIFGNGYSETVNYTYANYAGLVTALGQAQADEQVVYVTNNPATVAQYNVALGSPVSLTPQNIGDALQNLYEAAATSNRALLASTNRYKRLKFICSINTQTIYEQYLTTQPFKNNDTTEAGINRWKGYDLVSVAGLPDDTIVFTEAFDAPEGNLFFGLNSMQDEGIQMARTSADAELYFIKMLMKMDVNFGFGNKIFIYTTLTSADFESVSL